MHWHTFAQKGFVNTSIDDLTKLAGISHGSFFVHYARREDLIILAIEEIGKSMYERFLTLADEEMKVECLLRTHLEVVKEYESLYCFMVKEGVFLPEQARTAFFVLQNGISLWIGKAMKTDHLKIPFHYFFNLWLANLHYYLQNKGCVLTGWIRD